MTTPIGRGRGYANRNKECRKPGNSPSDNQGIGTGNTHLSDQQTSLKSPLSNSNAGMKLPPPSHAQSSNSSYNSYQNNPNARKIGNISMANHQSHVTSLSSTKPISNSSQNVKSNLGYPKDASKQSNNNASIYADIGQFDDNDIVTDENVQSVLYIDEKYSFLLEQVNALSLSDDGIKTNQKLKYIEEVITKICPESHNLRGVMEAIVSAAMIDSNTATKVSKMMCSLSFSRMHMHQQRILHVFISALRDKIEGLEMSLEGADQYLVNAATLLTDIYSESKLLEADDLTKLAHLIIQVFIGLLECGTSLALRTLNVHLMQYGKNLYASVPEKLDSVSLSVRKLIIARHPPSPSCRIWLTLLADQCLYRFQTLPKYLQDFYARQVDESDSEPRASRFTHEVSNSEDNHPSKLPQTLNDQKYDNVKSHEKRNSIKSDSSDKYSVTSNGERSISKRLVHDEYKDDVFEEKNMHHDSYHSSSLTDIYPADVGIDYSNSSQVHERKPRPILGAGSRNKNQYIGSSPMIYNQNSSGQEDSVDIPKFCPSIPPPNYIPKNMSVDSKNPGKNISASSENGDYWNYPPPQKQQSSNINKRFDSNQVVTTRLDLNSWRQSKFESESSIDSNNVCDERSSSFKKDSQETEINENKIPLNKSREFMAEELHSQKWIMPEENRRTSENFEELSDDYEKPSEANSSYWEKKKIDDTNENEKGWNKNSGRQRSESKNFDSNKKEHYRNKKETDDKDPNSKQKDNEDNKSWDSKVDLTCEKKLSGRRDSRGSRGSKRDLMEVSRKASYWTHDDRCDKDYDG